MILYLYQNDGNREQGWLRETLYSWGKQLAELGQLFCLCIKLANRVKAEVVRNDFELLSQHKWVSGGAPNQMEELADVGAGPRGVCLLNARLSCVCQVCVWRKVCFKIKHQVGQKTRVQSELLRPQLSQIQFEQSLAYSHCLLNKNTGCFSLNQWFSTGGSFILRETFGNAQRDFCLTQLQGMLLSSSGQRPGIL